MKRNRETADGRRARFALPRALPGVKSGACSGGRLVVLAAVGAVAAVALLVVEPPHSARATCVAPKPSLGIAPNGAGTYEAHTTLAATRAELELREPGEGAREFKWHIEYSASKAGPYSLAGSGSGRGTEGGSLGNNPRLLIRHLTPSTLYYARAVVEGECGNGEATTEFTTPPVSLPEVTVLMLAQHENGQWVGTTFAHLVSEVETNGAEVKYRFEYATSQGGPWTAAPGCADSISVAQEFAKPECALEGLKPETIYYVRVIAENEKGSVTREIEELGHPVHAGFETVTARPRVGNKPTCSECSGSISATNVTATSVTLHEVVRPDGSETRWRYEYATEPTGPWTRGPEGAIPASEADERFHDIPGELTGLTPSKVYYARFAAENEAGSDSSVLVSFETGGPPRAVMFATHTFATGGSETMRALGSITPDATSIDEVQTVTVDGAPSGGTFTLGFEGQTTVPIPFGASEQEVESALNALSKIRNPGGGGEGSGSVYVSGPHGGPYRVEFQSGLGGADQPQLTADGSGLTPSGTVTVATVQNGSDVVTHYHAEYIEQEQLEREGGWTHATKTAEQEVGAGPGLAEGVRFRFGLVFAASDLPGLQAGKTYHYRLVASNQAGTAASVDRTLNVSAAPVSSSEACPNELFRTGPSSNLPDCRAYEQVTPVDKEGTVEIQGYSAATAIGQQLSGEDGDHFLIETQVTKWGSNVGGYHWGYLFSRDEGKGWRMTPVASQPQSGPSSVELSLHSPDLTQTALESGWDTIFNKSPELTLQAGPVGGPYTTVASMPRADVPGEKEGNHAVWIAASADFSKLVFQAEDRKLLGSATGTAAGADLYEYSEDQVRQLNVDSSGKTIGSCGATIVDGAEDRGSQNGSSGRSSAHAVSADGSRVFFEAVPGSNCSEAQHLYLRVDGSQTVDLGEYIFRAANAAGTKLLVSKSNGGETFLYDTETHAVKHLLSVNLANRYKIVSSDFTSFYFTAGPLTPEAPALFGGGGSTDLYRYDIATETLHFIVNYSPEMSAGYDQSYVSPDGRYLYFESKRVADVPRGSGHGPGHETQVYSYDSVSNTVECLSCASPFKPEPGLSATFVESTRQYSGRDNVPVKTTASANGDYVFFDTPSALVPQDIDGEIEPQSFGELSSLDYSLSSDVYEWRRDGVDGCGHAQGCLSLVSSGTGGYNVTLLGTTESGRDVFFTSNAQLGPKDNDTAIDVYDARIGGGEPPPPPNPTECEGDSCISPVGAPLDTTPASLSFSGPGNLTPRPVTVAKAKVKANIRPCKRGRCKTRKRTAKRKAKRSARRGAGRHNHGGRK